ncbi:hypothetical protein JIG36_28915 [Actinoplanes sp. LDG1-06]|uniref:Secreted protein n=1 Tax=Paractinoplanes ovalisporus TaxID=2810368 RepID=A0ABS2AIA4_9ACTN|nr:hypothetical protein [Actinoplanes ovalisporus]MBM2619572.1 hypothetical protein [Actinoplanes ovalisporus]
MSVLGPLIALLGVVVGGALSYVFAALGESRKERWALGREWRGRKIDAYATYMADVRHLRDSAQRVAAGAGLDDTALPLSREEGVERLSEANLVRNRSFETVTLLADGEVVEAGRALNRAVWRLEWFARGLLDDRDTEGWRTACHAYSDAVNAFHECARRELGVQGRFTPREPEVSPRSRYEQERKLTGG